MDVIFRMVFTWPGIPLFRKHWRTTQKGFVTRTGSQQAGLDSENPQPAQGASPTPDPDRAT